MDPELSDDELNQLAAQVAERLPTGQYGDRVLLTRRQLVGAATGTLGAGALIKMGVEPAVAQAAGQIGTTSDPVDVVAYTIEDRNGDSAFISVAASGSIQLSSGSAAVTVDPNPPSGATYTLAIGPTQNAKISGRAFNDGDLKVELVETGTSVGNPTVPYDVIRVR